MEMEEKKQIEQLMKESNDNKKINELTLSQNNLSKSVQSLNIIKPSIEENKTENTKIKKIKKLLAQNIINEKDEKILSRSLSPQNILTQKIQKKISLNPIKKENKIKKKENEEEKKEENLEDNKKEGENENESEEIDLI